jgi:peptidoglycan-associated lipoprotein
MRAILIAVAVLGLVAGCAQTKPSTTPPSQAAQVTTPSPTTPATEEPKPAATEPAPAQAATPEPTQPAAMAPAPAAMAEPAALDLKVIHFDFDKYDIKPGEAALLDANATWLKSNPDVRVQLGGYCDERGTEEYNLALGERRAQAVRTYLAEHGVPADNMSTVSFGEEKPIDSGHDEAAWAKNRRVEFTRAGAQ